MDIENVKLIVSICALVISILNLCGLGVYMSLHTKKRFEKKTKEQEHAEKLKHQAYLEELRGIIKEENAASIKPLEEKLCDVEIRIEKLETRLDLNIEGTVTSLRTDMKEILDDCKARSYASVSDKANWNELYNTYAKLGGNHFKEYVDVWKHEMEELPIKKKQTRQKLNESKK